MKQLVGSEPALGLLVLLVSLPVVAALAYIVVYGAIEDPMLFARYAALYASGVLVGYAVRHFRKLKDGPRSPERRGD